MAIAETLSPETSPQAEHPVLTGEVYPPLREGAQVSYAPSHEVRNPDFDTRVVVTAGQRATAKTTTVYDVTSTYGKGPDGNRMPPPERLGRLRSAGAFVLRTLIADRETREFRRALRDFAPGSLTRFSHKIREGAATARYKVQDRWERVRYR